MKILAFTDMHGSKSALKEIMKKGKKADIVICCGDITIFGQKLDFFLSELNKLKIPILVIPGNHESDSEMKKASDKLENVLFMQNAAFESDDLIVLGAEGNGFAHEDRVFDKVAKKFEKILKSAFEKKDSENKRYVLMTHAPPYGTKLDGLFDSEHCGNKSIRRFIEKTCPVYAFCGHIHENRGKKDMIKKTTIANPGPFGEIFEV